MTTPRYSVVYTNRDKKRDGARPRLGSFVEFTEIQKPKIDSSSGYIFHALEEDTQKEGHFGCVRKFQRFNTEKDGEIKPINKIKAIAIKKYKTDCEKKTISLSTSIHREIRGFGEYINKPEIQIQFYEYIEGSTLDEYKPESEKETLEILVSLIEDLENLHTAGYTHNDLFGQNIIVSEEKQNKKPVKIIDFDFVKSNNNTTLDLQDLANLFERISMKPTRFHLSANSSDVINGLIKQIDISISSRRNHLFLLEIIKKDIMNYLLLLNEEIDEFEYSKKLLDSFLSDQIYLLNKEEQVNSKGAKEKKEHFKNIQTKLNGTVQQKGLENLIMETAIVAHHRRKRSRDQLGYILAGFFTFGYGFFDDWWDAYSWKCWKCRKFPAQSAYATAYNLSLANATRKITVNTTVCNNYEDLRVHAPFIQLRC